jgi:hypothetical protein
VFPSFRWRSSLLQPTPKPGAIMTPELERKIWYAYRDAHKALAAAADGDDVDPRLAAYMRKRAPEAGPAKIKAALKQLARDQERDPTVQAMYFAAVVSEWVPEASGRDIMIAMNNLARAMARNDPDALALMGRIRLS